MASACCDRVDVRVGDARMAASGVPGDVREQRRGPGLVVVGPSFVAAPQAGVGERSPAGECPVVPDAVAASCVGAGERQERPHAFLGPPSDGAVGEVVGPRVDAARLPVAARGALVGVASRGVTDEGRPLVVLAQRMVAADLRSPAFRDPGHDGGRHVQQCRAAGVVTGVHGARQRLVDGGQGNVGVGLRLGDAVGGMRAAQRRAFGERVGPLGDGARGRLGVEDGAVRGEVAVGQGGCASGLIASIPRGGC